MNNKYLFSSIPDDEFIRGNIPMTKEEIRTITVSKLNIREDSNILDIGGGTGSISIECALKAQSGKVTTIERNEEGIELINQNAKKFSINNLNIIHGKAPYDLPENSKYDCIVVGGTGGNMEMILDYCNKHLNDGGKIVGNMITLENMNCFLKYCKSNFKNVDISHVNVSKGKMVKDLTMMIATNGVYIISAQK